MEEKSLIIKEEELESLIETYSPEELLLKGKRFAEEDKYIQARTTFKKLISRNTKLNEIAKLYYSVIEPQILISKVGIESILGKELSTKQNSIISLIISSMINATELYQDKLLPKKDLFTIERFIDRFPFEEAIIPNRKEFERLYSQFKEYVQNVFLKEGSE